MMKSKRVYVVVCKFAETTEIDSVWTNRKKAQEYCDRLNVIDEHNEWKIELSYINNKFEFLKNLRSFKK